MAEFEPTKQRKVGKAAAYVLAQRQTSPPGLWLIVDGAVPDDPRYPGLDAVGAMQASARHRQTVADRIAERDDSPVVIFVAVWHHELAEHDIDPDTRLANGRHEVIAAWRATRDEAVTGVTLG